MASSVNLGSIHASIELDLSQFNKGITSAQNQLKTFESSVGKSVSNAQKSWQDGMMGISDSLMKFGKAATVGLTLPIATFGKKSLDAAVTYDKVMNMIKVASGEGQAAIDKLTPTIEEFGTKGRFSLLAVAEAVRDMVKDGLTPAEIATGQLEAAYNMATASGEELYDSQIVLSNAMASYGADVTQAAKFSDVLVGALNSSQLELYDLAGAMAYVAPVASGLEIPIETLSALIAELGDVGIKGSMAGTTLRRALLQLANPPKKAAESLAALDVQVFDAEGNMKDFGVILEDVKVATEDLTQEQRTQHLGNIFGAYAVAGMTSLVSKGADGLKEYQDQLSETGLAAKLAKEAEEGLAFQQGRLNSQVFKFKTQIGDQLEPLIKELANKVEDLNKWFSNLDAQTQQNIIKFAGLLAVIGPVLVILATVIKSVVFLSKGLGLLWKAVLLLKVGFVALAGALGISVGWLVVIVVAIVALVAAGIWLWKNWDKVKEFMLNVWIAVLEAWGNARTKILEFVNKLVTGVKNYLSKVKLDIETALLNVWISILEKWESARNKILEIVGKVKTGIINGFNAVVEFLTVTLPNALATFFTETLPNALIKFVTETLPNFFVSVVGAFLVGIGFILGIIIYGIPMLVTAIITFFQELPGKIMAVLTLAVESFKTWIAGIVAYLVVAVPALIESIGTWLSALPGIVWNWLKEAWNKFVEWRDDIYAYLAKAIVEIVLAVGEWLSALPGIVWAWLVETYQKFVTWGSDTYTSVSTSVTKIINDVVAWFGALPGKIWTALSTLASKVKDRFIEMKDVVKNYLASLPSQFMEWGTNLAKAFVEGFSKIGEWVRDKVKEGLDKAKGMLKGDSPPKEGPFKKIDVWGINIGKAWADGLIQGIGAIPEMLSSPTLATAQVSGGMSQPVSNYTTNAPVINVSIGMYAGSPMEKRQIAKDLSNALEDYNLGEGVINE